MTHEEYVKKVNELESQLMDVTNEFIETNKKYSVGDYLRVSFLRYDKLIQVTCKIMNIYPDDTHVPFSYYKNHPKGKLQYFARQVWRATEIEQKNRMGFLKPDENGICYGDRQCDLGPLSGSNLVCGYANIDWKYVTIEIITESEIL